MVSSLSAFAPYIDGGGLHINVSPGAALIHNSTLTFPTTSVTLAASTVNYVYLTNTGTITATTGAFPDFVFPIAIATTGPDGVSTLVDSRPDVAPPTGTPLVNASGSPINNSRMAIGVGVLVDGVCDQILTGDAVFTSYQVLVTYVGTTIADSGQLSVHIVSGSHFTVTSTNDLDQNMFYWLAIGV